MTFLFLLFPFLHVPALDDRTGKLEATNTERAGALPLGLSALQEWGQCAWSVIPTVKRGLQMPFPGLGQVAQWVRASSRYVRVVDWIRSQSTYKNQQMNA